ncbi:MAG TPA: hypothetical protein V6D48_13530, partial [Oculatellaceae cyanobacterium]
MPNSNPFGIRTGLDAFQTIGCFRTTAIVAFWLWREGKKHIVVIGTASAARYGQQTLQDYLTRLGANRVKLLPDAGAIA